MSMESNYYVIAGYDLTGNETDKFRDWKWSDEGEDYICNQCKSEIQFFDDPMSGSYLYFGYVLAAGDEYSFDTEMFDVSDIEKCHGEVKSELTKLQELGVITKDSHFKPVFKVIVFENVDRREKRNTMFEWKFDATIYRKSSGEVLLSKMCDTYDEAQKMIEENIGKFMDEDYPPTGHINKDYVQM